MLILTVLIVAMVFFVSTFTIATQFGNMDLDVSGSNRFVHIATLIIAPPSLTYLWVIMFFDVGLHMNSWFVAVALPTVVVGLLLWAVVSLCFRNR